MSNMQRNLKNNFLLISLFIIPYKLLACGFFGIIFKKINAIFYSSVDESEYAYSQMALDSNLLLLHDLVDSMKCRLYHLSLKGQPKAVIGIELHIGALTKI